MKNPFIICLMGPTASGKTDLAVKLVQHLPCEIISVDSAMVYRGMDIGTAKPGPEILKVAPHRLLDIRDPKDAYSAADFCVDTLREIADIHAHGKVPLLVGGTMLYFRALQKGMADLPAANPAVRAELLARAEREGWPALHDYLTEVDPEAAQRLHPNDSQRIQRALEVYALTGQSLSALQAAGKYLAPNYDVINIAIAPLDRSILHERIAMRFHNMLQLGFVEEVQRLYNRGDLTINTPAMRSVGYRQVWKYLDGEYTYAEMTERGIIATRQFAKRQLTWLRSWSPLTLFDSEAPNLLAQVLAHFPK